MLGAVLAIVLSIPQGDSVRVCFRDAATEQPVVGVRLEARHPGAVAGSAGRAAHPDRARLGPVVGHCAVIAAGDWRVRRIGYRARSLVLSGANAAANATASNDTVVVPLTPLTTGGSVGDAAALEPVVVRATADAPTLGRATASLATTEARASGVGSVPALAAALPYVQLRSARGEAGLSLRGGRREQVVVTLDGLPLNDPATGTGDLADLPLAAVSRVTVLPGADPLGAGLGATAGVVAVQSSATREATVRAGAFGASEVQGAWHATAGRAIVRGGAAVLRARNDFPFVNRAGATGAAPREKRVNNDERRATLFGSLLLPQAQVTLLAADVERGMVGPANVRSYDADRLQARRLLLRALGAAGPVQVTGGARAFTLAYRDPTRPVLDRNATAWASDIDVAHAIGALRWRVGGGADAVRATGGVRQSRTRAFVAGDWAHQAGPSRATVGARLDGVGGGAADVATGGAGTTGVRASLTPSFSLAGDLHRDAVRRAGPLRGHWRTTASLRTAQAVRVPTLYDLYFSSPQRLDVRALRAERVLADVEAALDVALRRGDAPGDTRLEWRAAAVRREVVDAIVWFPGNFSWSPANVARERLAGVDTHLRAVTRRGELTAWSALYDARLETGALRIPTPYVARASGGLRGVGRIGAWTATANVQWLGARPFTAGPRDPAFELPPVTTLDLALARTVTFPQARALISASLDNATDRDWQSVRGFPMPGRAWAVAITLIPAPNR
jgi:outer membrane cobalamin receptor